MATTDNNALDSAAAGRLACTITTDRAGWLVLSVERTGERIARTASSAGLARFVARHGLLIHPDSL